MKTSKMYTNGYIDKPTVVYECSSEIKSNRVFYWYTQERWMDFIIYAGWKMSDKKLPITCSIH
jgi:hypothetical protein